MPILYIVVRTKRDNAGKILSIVPRNSKNSKCLLLLINVNSFLCMDFKDFSGLTDFSQS